MAVFDIIFNMILIFSAISLFNFIRYILKIRKIIKENKDNPNIKGISIVNGQIKVIEKDDKILNPGAVFDTVDVVEVPKVVDFICHKEIEIKDAYRIIRDDKEYFFCSWECREQFLKGEKGGGDI